MKKRKAKKRKPGEETVGTVQVCCKFTISWAPLSVPVTHAKARGLEIRFNMAFIPSLRLQN
jgi:hypothetical protein